MKASRILLVVGGVLVLVGSTFFAGSFGSSTSETTSIPAGSHWYMYFEFDLLGGGRIQGDYRETTGGTLDLFVLTESEYNAYRSGGTFASLWSIGDSRQGTIDVTLPGSGKYFMVADHGSAYEGVPQQVHLALRVLGIDPPPFASAIALLAVGVVSLSIGVVKRRRLASRASFGPASDVTFFKRSEPPQPPVAP